MGIEPATAKYFLTVYGSQRAVNRPKFSHTYATFTRQPPTGATDVDPLDFTISWLPRDGGINPFGPPEPGRNYSFVETIQWLDEGGSTDRWASPVTEITEELFRSTLERYRQLEAATLLYKMVDSMLTRPNAVSNCIHAVSDIPLAVQRFGKLFTGALHGQEASRLVYHYLQPFFITHPDIPQEEERDFEDLHRAHLAHQDHSDNPPPTPHY